MLDSIEGTPVINIIDGKLIGLVLDAKHMVFPEDDLSS